MTVPVTPLTMIDPVPSPRMPPKPNSPTSVCKNDVVGEQTLPEHPICELTLDPSWVLVAGVPLMFVC